jgi:prolyl-tRNA editing enzyme YbaK/EbsC (Cys-tRNA(Pro) deacylase)
MMTSSKNSVQRVIDALETMDLPSEVIDLPSSTRTAVEAAQAVGCDVGQIVKSLVFRTSDSDQPILVMASGVNRVDEDLVGSILGEEIEFASPDYVRETTGFAIGGVSPLGHLTPIKTFLDEDLLQYQSIWAAAGSPHTVFSIPPQVLVEASQAETIPVHT